MATAPLLFPTKLQNQLGWRQTIDVEGLDIGISSFDSILGGCPRGRITEVIGAPSSGRTSLVHRLLAAAAGRGEYCAIVDSTNAFDPWTASQAGADLDALVWVQCGHNVEHAMKSADLLIHSGGFGVVILDLCDVTALWTRRIPLSWWYRFQRAVEKSPTVLLIVGRELHAKSCSSLTVEVRREDAPFDGTFPFQLLKAARYKVSPRKPYNAGGAEAGGFIARA
jgi:hypothetical protein